MKRFIITKLIFLLFFLGGYEFVRGKEETIESVVYESQEAAVA